MRDDRERLLDIQQAITDINKYTCKGKNAFETEELIQTWILHHLLILGEAASKISDQFREEHTEIPWPKIIGMRNILIHNYFGIDIEAVWSIIENYLPELQIHIEKLLE